MSVLHGLPREPDTAALAGAQPKLRTRLNKYYERKTREQPHRTREQLLACIAEALPQKGWELSRADVAWCMPELNPAIPENG